MSLSRFRLSVKALVMREMKHRPIPDIQVDLMNVVLDLIDVHGHDARMTHYDRLIDDLLDYREKFKRLVPTKSEDE